jgi:hypothetical protein
VQPRTWTQLELLAFDCEAKAPRQNLYRGCSGCLVLGELIAPSVLLEGRPSPSAPYSFREAERLDSSRTTARRLTAPPALRLL